MRIIPVIDLANGVVVRAVRGERGRYRPIESALCRSHDPAVVAPILLKHAASSTLYIADLDALTGGAAQVEALGALLQRLPGTEVWLDAGFRDATAVTQLRRVLGAHGRQLTPVFASEALPDQSTARACLADRVRSLLSLDTRGDIRLDPAGCWQTPSLWPERIIVMTLEKVGAGEGPAVDTLRAVRAMAPEATLIGAGGLRDDTDAARMAEEGAAAWLVASALHDLKLSRR